MIALPLLLLLWAGDAAYDTQVAEAVRLAREGNTAAARQQLDAAIAREPARAEAWSERGGLAFREGRYADAIPDLQAALRRRDEAHTRSVLAAALSLSNRPDEALVHWNKLGRPVVRRITVEGLQRTADYVARREISVFEGEMLKSTDLAETRQQLESVGVFRAIDLRTVPLPDGQVDLAVRMGERHGFGNPWELLGLGAAHAVKKRVGVEYLNVDGRGVNVATEYRWDARNEKSVEVEWPRPFGLAGYMTTHVEGGRQPYDLPDPTMLRRKAAAVMFSAVLQAQSRVRWGVRFEDRSFDRPRPDAANGRLVTGELGITRRFSRVPHVRVDLEAGLAHSLGLDETATFGRWLGGTRLSWTPSPYDPAQGALQRFEVALRGQAGGGYGTVPLDAMFAPGAASDMEFPLRAHKIRRDGVLGQTPIGPEIFSLSNELRFRVLRHPRADVGLVPFWDVVHLPETAQGGARTLHDIGIGGRVGLRGSLVLRADYAHSLTDGKDAWSFGIGQTF